MEERKSMGSALVDVFDAGVALVKSEAKALARKASDVAKEKGLGVVLMLAAVAPLTMGLIFLILTFFFGLMALGLGAWAAALIIALVSFLVTGALLFLGFQKLAAEAEEDLLPQRIGLDTEEVKLPKSSGLDGVQLDKQVVSDKSSSERVTQHRQEPQVHEPTVLKDQPGIQVSTAQTFRTDMQKGGYND